MLIHYAASGGFANLRLNYTANTATLPPEQAQNLERLIQQADFFQLPEPQATSAPGGAPDMRQYEISVEQDGQRRSLSFNDMNAPDQLRPLLERLQDLALDQRRS